MRQKTSSKDKSTDQNQKSIEVIRNFVRYYVHNSVHL